jgi:hypothetical protein
MTNHSQDSWCKAAIQTKHHPNTSLGQPGWFHNTVTLTRNLFHSRISSVQLNSMYSSLYSAVSIGSAYGLGLEFGSRVKNFLFSMSTRATLQPLKLPIQRVLGVLSLGVKQLECKADQPLPNSAEVYKTCIYSSLSHTSSQCGA